ncbi:MAG: cardiolipin synthase [Clostridia bacterium]|nr:cardiolipin synthase [Clostridia bacterium]
MQKKISGFFYRKTTVIVLLILLQLAVLVLSVWRMANFFPYVYLILLLLSLAVLVWLINSDINPSYKLAWAIPILVLPIFGGVFYLLFGTSKVSSRLKKSREHQQKFKTKYLSQENALWEEAQKEPSHIVTQMTYLKQAGYPVYQDEGSLYFPLGDLKFPKMLEELKQAKEYIFLEYFIISDGVMWQSILSVLKEKAKEGVEVRVIFDDCGSLGLLPEHYERELNDAGIHCRVFNPLRPSLTITMNNRDHRKILIIDGKVAFTGGVNIGDEYINKLPVHGHWKDSALMLRGQAVNTLLSLFFEMWNLIYPDDTEVSSYYRKHNKATEKTGYIQPYGSDPFGTDTVGENVYLNLITKASKEIFILTPYLIVDNELTTALCLAAKNGVDVTIVTPHVADKWYVHLMTVSSYPQLIKAGVNIYEYTPGFLHSKVFSVDGEIATVGTINMDFRSLYLHFECGVVLYCTETAKSIREDCRKTMELSQKITLEDCKKIRWYHRLFQRLIRVFSPLM